MWFILLTGGYDPPELIGPFSAEDFAEDHLKNNIELGHKIEGVVIKAESPSEDS